MNLTAQQPQSDPPPFDLAEENVAQLGDALGAYHAEFAELFFRKEQTHWSLKYLEGLLLPSPSKSVEKLALSVPGGHVRNMQQFLGIGAISLRTAQVVVLLPDVHAHQRVETVQEGGERDGGDLEDAADRREPLPAPERPGAAP